ncbi:MAG: hypothetical protein KA273_03350 [Bacteroidales bacterium]|nr:hypothetical protein [Bacteroidales bacterium]
MKNNKAISQLLKALEITIEDDNIIISCDDSALRDAYYKLKDEDHSITEEFYIFVRNEFLNYLSQQLEPFIQFAFSCPENIVCDSYRHCERGNKNDEGEQFWPYIQSDIEMFQYVYSDYVEKEEKLSIIHTPNQPLKLKFIHNHTPNENKYTKKDFTEFEIIAYEILQRDKKRNEDYIEMLDNTSSEKDPVLLFRTEAKNYYKQSE